MALKCLSAAHAIDPSNPTLHLQILQFRKALDSLAEPIAPQVAEVVNPEFEKLLPKTQKLEEWNESFLSANKDSAPHVQAALSARQLLNKDSKAQNEKELVASLDALSISFDDAVSGLDLLGEWGSDKTAFADKASKKWPQASAFQLN